MKQIAFVGCVAVVLQLVACAHGESEAGSSSADETAATPVKAELGESCGAGVTGLVTECASGLRCENPSHGAGDQLGTCVEILPGERGGTCGTGITGITVECQAGLVCQVEAHHGAGDVTGTCVGE